MAEREQTESTAPELTPAAPEAVVEATPAAAGPISGFGAAMGFGRAGTATPRPRLTPGQVLQLQRSIGNAQTSRLIARLDDGMEPTETETRSNEEIVKDAIKNSSVPDAKNQKLRSSNYAGISGDDRYKLIQILCNQGWIGPLDETALEILWNSYGPTGIAAQYEADGGVYFTKSVEGGANLYEISSVKQVTVDFEKDVKSTALDHLDANLLFITREMAKLGLTDNPLAPQTAEEGKKRQDEQEKRLKEVVILGVQAKRAEEARDKLLDTKVGYFIRHSKGGPYDVSADYSPTAKPQKPPSPQDFADGARSWEDVDDDFHVVMAVIAGLGVRSPALYAAMARGRTAGMADPATALETAKESMLDTKKNITETRPKIGSGDLDWRDLAPIHQQLYSGQAFTSRDWSKGLNQAVAKSLLEGHENTQFWVTLGLSSLAAAAFIISELATGGLATAAWAAVGIGIGVGQAAASWEKYEDLSTAAGAAASDDLQLITKGQADAQLIAAVLDTVFAAIDIAGAVWGPAKAALKAGRILEEGAEAAGKTALRDLGRLADDAARKTVIEQGLKEFGLEGVVKQSGKSAEELAGLVGKESEAGKKLLAFEKQAAEGGVKAGEEAAGELADQMKSLGSLDAGAREAAVVNALDRHGPVGAMEMAGGYDKIVKALGNDSAAAKRLMEWRNGVEAEVKKYMSDQLRTTGRRGMPSNDMDMSALDKGATEGREQARTWLAGRLGVDPGQVEHLIGGQLFTDPRRLHVYDKLPDATRALIDQQTNKFAIEASQNMRLAEALKNGDELLAKEIREQMASMGLKETKIAKLSAGERLKLGHEIDELQGKMEAALVKGEPADDFARGIGERQGLINANEPGAYLGGGGGRANVTGRPDSPFPGYEPGTEAAKLSGPEKASRMFEEQRMLDEAVGSLQKASTPEEVAAAIKKVGKYGGRQSGTAAEFAGTAELDALTATFKELQKKAESGAVAAEARAQIATTVEQAYKALDQLSRDVEANLTKWAKEVGGASGEELAAIQARIIWGMNLKSAIKGAKQAYGSWARLIRLGLDPNVTGVPAAPAEPPK